MKAKKAMYAAVGAPVVVYRMATEAVSELRSRLNEEADSLGKTAQTRMNKWAAEGEKVWNRLSDAKVVDEFASRVDFDQVSTQVNKLRDQLEDLLATWRSSFRPEKLPTIKAEASSEGVKFETIPQKKSTARKSTAAKKAGGVKTSTKKSAAKSTATKSAAKKPTGAKKTGARKASSAKKVAAAS
ncbi:MAG TPA: hypothetical protein VJ935_12345 [Acidimicrobiia bacterium]|nr:hypothetical protein [Acidimicrobiia bacterium]